MDRRIFALHLFSRFDDCKRRKIVSVWIMRLHCWRMLYSVICVEN